ncbi:MAG: glycoside hydrolase family 3 N-terminal domain-containing protein [Candidatus Zixiibacteriota bacterium]
MIDRIGQLFITGFEGELPSDDFLRFFKEENLGGLILFEEQCNPHKIAEATIAQIVAVADEAPFIAVDQEGGRVCRFRGVPAEFPSPAVFGEKNDIESYKEWLHRSTYYLKSLGLNLWLGPVADLNLDKRNKCLESRTFHSNPVRAIKFIEAAIRTAQSAGLLTCLKHFPGLGATHNDPHTELAIGDYDFETFLNRESLTFKAGIDIGADMVMTTHLHLPAIDKEMATNSPHIIGHLLRDKLNFDGIVITDDLLMNGSKSLGDFGERAFNAFTAGHDILLFGRNYMATKMAIEYFKKAYKDGTLDKDMVEKSLGRISGVKLKMVSSVIL